MTVARPPASIIVTTESWLGAQACVDRLKPRLGVRDEIIVAIADEFGVGAPKATELRAGGRGDQGRVRTVIGAPDQVIADAVRLARHHHVVFLEPSLVPTGHWLDAMLAPFETSGVVATGPTIVTSTSTDALRDLARTWSADHRGDTADVEELAPGCVAVARDAFLVAGGLDGLVGRLVIAREALVGVIGATSIARVRAERRGPLVSACLIVKDEADNLARCLASLGDLVDEVVVYDTGSTDATIEIARSAGAVVLAGEWVDDFAAARNAALDACTGEWILWIDADEVLIGDHGAFRTVLEADPPVDTISVTIDNLDDAGRAIGYSNQAAKVFRRARACWKGRLHEQVVARDGSELRIGHTEHIRMLHAGYLDDEVTTKHKSERNIRIAEAEIAEGTDRPGLVRIHLGRSLASAGRLDEALARFDEALAATDHPVERRLALRHGAEALLDTGRAEDARVWIDRLREVSKKSHMADYLDAIALADIGDEPGALKVLMKLRDVRDEDGFVIPDHVLRLRRALLLRNAKRWSEAADELLAIVTADTAPPWSLLAEVHWRAGRDADEVAGAITEAQLVHALGQLLAVTPEAADGIVEALHRRWGDDAAVLAAACAVASKLPVARALEWGARLRRAGLDGQCPLLSIANDEERPTSDRVQAACVVMGGFGDERAKAAIRTAAALVPDTDLVATLIQIDELAPALLPDFVGAAATGGDRTRAVADALDALGASDVAADLRATA